MFLKRIFLKQFRNYSELSLDFHPGFNFIHGQNAQGKTNLIEAIDYVSTLSSFRHAKRDELIHKNHEDGLIQTTLDRDGLEDQISIYLAKKGRVLKLNEKRPNVYKDYYGLVPVLLFEPRHVYLLRDTPAQRRRFLNQAQFTFEPNQATILRDYAKVIQQKNRLLRDNNQRCLGDLLPVWDEQLIVLGAQIIAWRLSWLAKINERLVHEYEAITGTREEISVRYESRSYLSREQNCLPRVGGDPEDPEKSGSPLSRGRPSEAINDIQAGLRQKLSEKSSLERIRRECLVGPHRDDFWVELSGRHVGKLGSQGENRSVVIALKIAMVGLFSAEKGQPPILLLDDVSSELDPQRRAHLFRHLNSAGGQVFITTTDELEEESLFGERGRSFIVDGGNARVLG